MERDPNFWSMRTGAALLFCGILYLALVGERVLGAFSPEGNAVPPNSTGTL